MSKSKDTKKDVKKEPAKTLKEKQAEKRLKKAKKGWMPFSNWFDYGSSLSSATPLDRDHVL